MRNCLIHVGTHKTGTTAIQVLLSQAHSAFQDRGYLYPRAGRLDSLPGHHNIAWQISGDCRFRPKIGTIEDLIREVRDTPHDIILSSEDLECSLYAVDKFFEFVSLFQSNGFKITFILYVRDQIDYLPRIYLTSIASGFDSTFDQVLGQVLDRAEFRWQNWIFNFDYLDLLNRLHALPDVDVIVRSYDRVSASVGNDFLSILGLGLSDLGIEKEIIANVSRPPKTYLQRFVENRMGRKLSAGEHEAINTIATDIGKLQMSPAAILQMDRRFFDSNRRLAAKCAIPEFATTRSQDTTQSCDIRAPFIEDVFSADTETRFKQLSSI